MLKCPCGKDIYIEKEYGVLTYKHSETGNYCGKLNTFDASVIGYISKKIAQALKAEDATTFNVYNLGQPLMARTDMYKQIAGDKKLRLYEKLKFISDEAINKNVQNTIVREMAMVFGEQITKVNFIAVGLSRAQAILANHTMPRGVDGRPMKPVATMENISVGRKAKGVDIVSDITNELAQSFMKQQKFKSNQLNNAIRQERSLR